LKRLAPYRTPSDRDGKNRKKLKELKKAIARRRWGEELAPEEEHVFRDYSAKRPHDGAEAEEQPKSKEKRLGKKQRQKLKTREEQAETDKQ
jgi:hypothetical protein